MTLQLTIPQEIDLARRAIRGAASFELLGLDKPAGATPNPESDGYQFATINITAAGSHVLIPGAAGQYIIVHEVCWYTDTQQDLEFKMGAQSVTGPLKAWPGQSGSWWPYTGKRKFPAIAGAALILENSAVGQLSGYVAYEVL